MRATIVFGRFNRGAEYLEGVLNTKTSFFDDLAVD